MDTEEISKEENLTEEISFEDLGLDELALAAVAKKGFETPSPIQVLAIPRLLNGDANMIAKARTGTGKTAAFGLPLIQKVRGQSDSVRALILEPTRELAVQTCNELQSFTTDKYPRTAVLYGGASYGLQIKDLRRGAEIVVGTPGRIKDHIERGTLNIEKIDYFILDEGDEMLDMGFIDDIEEIFSKANPESRILLFSATMPDPILKIAQKFMGDYEIIEEGGITEEPLLIDQKYWLVRENEKIEALVRLIDISPDFYGLVFTQTKADADMVSRLLDERGYEAAALHGDIPQTQREKILARFRSKKTRILVATDVAARGIDITGLSHVVNYSLPFDGATYVHRIGRTGRAGTSGCAVTFVRPEERRKLRFLQQAVARASKGEMKEEQIPSIESVLEVKQNRIFDEIKKTVTADGIVNAAAPEFAEMARKLCEDHYAEDVLASVLEMIYGKTLNKEHYGKIGAIKPSMDASNQLRIYVQLGRKDGFNAKAIADFFSKLLHIPGRMVDRIDVSSTFSLVSLPVSSGNKVLELSKKDRKLPHMHVDSKSDDFAEPRKRSRSGSRGRSAFGGRNESSGRTRNSSSRSGGARSGKRSSSLRFPSPKAGSANKYKKAASDAGRE